MLPMQYFGIKGYQLVRYESKPNYRLYVEPARRPQCCRHCGHTKIASKGLYERRVRHLEVMGMNSELIVQCQRFKCRSCEKTFVPELPGIKAYKHSSEPYREHIYELHHRGICASSLAEHQKLGQATVNRIYSTFTERKAKERMSSLAPRMIGIDEHTLHKGYQMITTLCDLKNHRVFDIAKGRSAKDLRSYLMSLQGREGVEMVCIDLSSSYRKLIKECFPNARIVADRFHVIRIIQYRFMELFKQICPDIANHRGMLAALRKNPENLTENQQIRLNELFKKHPPIQVIYEQQLKIRRLMNRRHTTKKQARKLARRLMQIIRELTYSTFEPMRILAKTLKNWDEPIACMWRFNKNNGITEGFHRKMKLIQRRAYGFKNFDNYRLRVIAQCG